MRKDEKEPFACLTIKFMASIVLIMKIFDDFCIIMLYNVFRMIMYKF